MIAYQCDVCGQPADKDKIMTAQIGARSAGYLCGAVDVCPGCLHRPLSDIIAAAGRKTGAAA